MFYALASALWLLIDRTSKTRLFTPLFRNCTSVSFLGTLSTTRSDVDQYISKFTCVKQHLQRQVPRHCNALGGGCFSLRVKWSYPPYRLVPNVAAATYFNFCVTYEQKIFDVALIFSMSPLFYLSPFQWTLVEASPLKPLSIISRIPMEELLWMLSPCITAWLVSHWTAQVCHIEFDNFTIRSEKWPICGLWFIWMKN